MSLSQEGEKKNQGCGSASGESQLLANYGLNYTLLHRKAWKMNTLYSMAANRKIKHGTKLKAWIKSSIKTQLFTHHPYRHTDIAYFLSAELASLGLSHKNYIFYKRNVKDEEMELNCLLQTCLDRCEHHWVHLQSKTRTILDMCLLMEM